MRLYKGLPPDAIQNEKFLTIDPQIFYSSGQTCTDRISSNAFEFRFDAKAGETQRESSDDSILRNAGLDEQGARLSSPIVFSAALARTFDCTYRKYEGSLHRA